ncbi:hypothetical protein B0H66DRAFT_557084 [Apodospora peruviana]|uniref:Uncharacterized protein n=1 Tax=Apodospora peruviana TaxID=516989 RepID=A0AAE0M3V2_9PEZI|nr:hypothetical protein B0H66DRAFT_557084 [Apodospora peruviana]
MNSSEQAALEEKARLQRQYEESAAASSSLSRPLPLASPDSTGSGHSNTVPMTQEELEEHESNSPLASPTSLNRSQTPPPYSGPSTSNTAQDPAPPQPKGPQKYPGLPRLDYRLYRPPLFELSADSTTIKSTAPYLSSNATAMVALVRAQSTIPPKPQVHITGKRGTKVDFAIKLNLMSLLVPEDPRQRMDYIRCLADGEVAMRGGTKPSIEPEVGDGGLEEWVRRFVEDSRSVKSFMLERVVANLDVNWLEGQIRSMIASTAYKGVVTVTFPVTHAKVVVQNPDRVNKFFTSVTTLFSGKNKYEVVKAVWPFATHKSGEPGRRCVVQSEETWWREWRDPIKHAIATKRQGWVTNEDKLEAIMEGVGKGLSAVDWGPEY